jgi:hypothetical protein
MTEMRTNRSDVDLQKHDGEIAWATSYFSPSAFRYFVPGIMLSSARLQLDESDAVMAIIWNLDGKDQISSNRAKWDEHFQDRWSAFSPKQYVAMINWLSWVRESREQLLEETVYSIELAGLDDIDAAIATIEWFQDQRERQE